MPRKRPSRLMLLDTYGLVYRAFFALPALTTTKRRADQRRLRLHDDAQQAHRRREADARDRRVRQGPAGRARGAVYGIQSAARRDARRSAQPVRARAQCPRDASAFRSSRSKGKKPTTSSRRSRAQAEEAGEADARRHRRSRSAADRRRTHDRAHDAPRHHRSRPLRSGGGARALRPRAASAAGLSRAQRRSVGQPARHSRRRREDRDQADQAAGSLDALLADPALAGTPKLEKLVEEYGEQARMCRDVSIVRRDLPLTLDWERPLRRTQRCRALPALPRARVQDAARAAQAAGRRSAALCDRRKTRRHVSHLRGLGRSAGVRAPCRRTACACRVAARRARPARRRDRRQRRARRAASAFAAGALAHEAVRAALAHVLESAPRIVALRREARRTRACRAAA